MHVLLRVGGATPARDLHVGAQGRRDLRQGNGGHGVTECELLLHAEQGNAGLQGGVVGIDGDLRDAHTLAAGVQIHGAHGDAEQVGGPPEGGRRRGIRRLVN